MFSQALLLNRSPRLDHLDTAAFIALRAHPATDGHEGSMLYALQRVVADLGHCDPPVRTGYNHAPEIEGADPAWADWIERWHATSTLTPRVRAQRAVRRHAGWGSRNSIDPNRAVTNAAAGHTSVGWQRIIRANTFGAIYSATSPSVCVSEIRR